MAFLNGNPPSCKEAEMERWITEFKKTMCQRPTLFAGSL